MTWPMRGEARVCRGVELTTRSRALNDDVSSVRDGSARQLCIRQAFGGQVSAVSRWSLIVRLSHLYYNARRHVELSSSRA